MYRRIQGWHLFGHLIFSVDFHIISNIFIIIFKVISHNWQLNIKFLKSLEIVDHG